MSKPNTGRTKRKNERFTKLHPELPKGKRGYSSRKEWAKLKKSKHK